MGVFPFLGGGRVVFLGSPSCVEVVLQRLWESQNGDFEAEKKGRSSWAMVVQWLFNAYNYHLTVMINDETYYSSWLLIGY